MYFLILSLQISLSLSLLYKSQIKQQQMQKIQIILMIALLGIVSIYAKDITQQQQRNLQETCSVNCLKCTSPNICTSCRNGFWLSFDSVCKPCPVNCLNCTDGVTCTYCASSTYLDTNPTTGQKLCLPCSQNCLNCISDICNTCRQGYRVENGVCERQPFVWWIVLLSVIELIFLVLVIIVLVDHFKANGVRIPETFFQLRLEKNR